MYPAGNGHLPDVNTDNQSTSRRKEYSSTCCRQFGTWNEYVGSQLLLSCVLPSYAQTQCWFRNDNPESDTNVIMTFVSRQKRKKHTIHGNILKTCVRPSASISLVLLMLSISNFFCGCSSSVARSPATNFDLWPNFVPVKNYIITQNVHFLQ